MEEKWKKRQTWKNGRAMGNGAWDTFFLSFETREAPKWEAIFAERNIPEYVFALHEWKRIPSNYHQLFQWIYIFITLCMLHGKCYVLLTFPFLLFRTLVNLTTEKSTGFLLIFLSWCPTHSKTNSRYVRFSYVYLLDIHMYVVCIYNLQTYFEN